MFDVMMITVFLKSTVRPWGVGVTPAAAEADANKRNERVGMTAATDEYLYAEIRAKLAMYDAQMRWRQIVGDDLVWQADDYQAMRANPC